MNEITKSNREFPSDVSELSRFVLIGRDRLAAVRAAIRAIDKVGVASEVYRQKLGEAQEIAEAVLDAEVRLGELRKGVERSKGNQYTKVEGDNGVAKHTLRDFDEKASLNKREGERLQAMASHPDIIEQTKAKARENGEIVTRKAVLDAIREDKRQRLRDERREEIDRCIESVGDSIDLDSPPCRYRVVYADPPWQYSDRQDIETLGGAEKHYPTMSTDRICKLPVPAADDAVLFLWATSPMLEESFKVINAWGFRYKASFVWDKVKHNMGHYNSVRHEFLLIATKGSCTPDTKKLFDSVQSIERGEHSKKPDEFREIIDTLYIHGRKLEMFAREPHDGWDVWGNMV